MGNKNECYFGYKSGLDLDQRECHAYAGVLDSRSGTSNRLPACAGKLSQTKDRQNRPARQS